MGAVEDAKGRKSVVNLALATLCVSNLIIGVLPPARSIGAFSWFALGILRTVQGQLYLSLSHLWALLAESTDLTCHDPSLRSGHRGRMGWVQYVGLRANVRRLVQGVAGCHPQHRVCAWCVLDAPAA